MRDDSQSNFKFWPLLLLVALFVPRTLVQPEAEKPASKDSKHFIEVDTTVVRQPHDLVREFCESRSATASHNSSPCDSTWSIRSVIATIPDPIDSRFDYTYDRYLDAIQRAAEADEYLLDRFDLPWQSERDNSKRDERRYTEGPGALLFRGAKEKKLLLVFLVGETPTSGVHKTALHVALDLARNILTLNENRDLLILGPAFSGSMTSLELTLAHCEALHGKVPVHVVSGSVTAASLDSTLARFETTVVPDSTARRIIVQKMKRDWGAQENEIAFLSESNTAYGRATSSTDTTLAGSSAGFLNLHFPLHIGALRGAGNHGPARGSDQLSQFARESHTSLADRDKDKTKEVPALLSQLEPSSIEMALTTLLSTLAREHIRYIGLFASDLLDRLYLAQIIRETCPNTRLFTLSNDLTYLHSSANQDYLGMLVVSPYPLFPLNQLWSFPCRGARDRIQFQNHPSQGVYNAMLRLLGRKDLLLECGMPFTAQQDLPPPLWISAVGHEAIWPLEVRDTKNPRGPFNRSAPPESQWLRGWWTTSASVAFSLLMIPLLVLGWCVFSQVRKRSGTPNVIGLKGALFGVHVATDDDAPARRGTVLFTFALLLLLPAVVVAGVVCLPILVAMRLDISGLWKLWWLYLRPFAVIAITGFLFVSAYFAMRLAWAQKDSLRSLRILAAPPLGAFVLLGACIWLAVSWLASRPDTALFLFLRSADLGNGLSPLRPLLLVASAAVLHAICSLRHLRLQERCSSGQLLLGFATGSLAGIDAREEKIRRIASAVWLQVPYVRVLAPLMAAACLWAFWRLGFSLETRLFDAIVAVALTATYVVLAATGLRVALMWRELRHLLMRLEAHPVLAGFEPVGRPVELNAPLWSLNTLAQSCELAVQIFNVDEIVDLMKQTSPKFDFPATLAAAQNSLLQARLAYSDYDWRRYIEARRRTQNALTETAKAVTLAVEFASSPGHQVPGWRQLGYRFLATRIIDFVQEIFQQMRGLWSCGIVSVLLLLTAVGSYPWLRRDLFLEFNWLFVALLVGVAVVILLQMNRNQVLSVATGGTPNELNWDRDFVSKLFIYGLLPVLGLLGVQFPNALQQIGPWFGRMFGGSH